MPLTTQKRLARCQPKREKTSRRTGFPKGEIKHCQLQTTLSTKRCQTKDIPGLEITASWWQKQLLKATTMNVNQKDPIAAIQRIFKLQLIDYRELRCTIKSRVAPSCSTYESKREAVSKEKSPIIYSSKREWAYQVTTSIGMSQKESPNRLKNTETKTRRNKKDHTIPRYRKPKGKETKPRKTDWKVPKAKIIF